MAASPSPEPVTSRGAPLPTLRVSGLSPGILRRGEGVVLEVRGEGMAAGITASILQGRRPATGIRVLRVEVVNAGLLKVSVLSEPELPLGGYTLILRDRDGVAIPGLQIEVVL